MDKLLPTDIKRLEAVQKRLDGRAALMLDANQLWDRATALRMGRAMEAFGPTWIEEPPDAYDAEGLTFATVHRVSVQTGVPLRCPWL